MPAMAFAGTEDGTDPGSNTATETGQEVENEDLTSNTEGDTGNDVEESNVQEEQAESNTPTANQPSFAAFVLRRLNIFVRVKCPVD